MTANPRTLLVILLWGVAAYATLSLSHIPDHFGELLCGPWG